MQNPIHENHEILITVLIYLFGILLGVAAKLATLNKTEKLSMKTVFSHTIVAFACAWVVWWWLEDKINNNVLAAISVVIGRFSDVILMEISNAMKNWVLSVVKKDL